MEYIKKYWFVALIAILFVCGIGYFASEEQKNTFKGKQTGGKDVVFEYNGENVTADDLYDEMFSAQAPALTMNFVQTGVYRNAFEPSEDLLTEAKLYYDNYITYIKSYYGENYASYILPSLKSLGYSKVEDLQDYYVAMLMMDEINKDYITARIDGLYDEFYVTKSPRILSHILVKMTDPENPTDEEKAKMDSVDAAFREGKTFAEVAESFSDDSTASNGGLLGYADKDTSYDESFAAAAFALTDGETSGWVKSQYGYHLIKVDAADQETLMKETEFFNAMISYYNLNATIFYEQYQKLNIDYHGNTELEEYVLSQIKPADAETEGAE